MSDIADDNIDELKQHALCYLATPYSKYPSGIHHAFADAATFAANLLKAGVNVYSPIAHTHPLAIYGNIDPLDHNIWLPFDATMMHLAEALIVARMPGWESSKGVMHEIEVFRAAHKPIYYLPGDWF
jgi:hypothetical protein